MRCFAFFFFTSVVNYFMYLSILILSLVKKEHTLPKFWIRKTILFPGNCKTDLDGGWNHDQNVLANFKWVSSANKVKLESNF